MIEYRWQEGASKVGFLLGLEKYVDTYSPSKTKLVLESNAIIFHIHDWEKSI